MKPMFFRVLLVTLTAAALGSCSPSGGKGEGIAQPSSTGDDWTSYGKDASEQRFAPRADINPDTIKSLGVAWYAEFDTDRGQEATPLMVDGTLYTSTAWSKVYAFDAKTGKQRWAYDPAVDGSKAVDGCCDVVNRGVAVANGKVFVGAFDGRLIALDAKTGAVKWQVQTTDVTKPYTITGAPRVVKGKVLIGNGGAEYGVRGYITAYDADTGKQIWRFYTVPNPTGAPDGAASDAILKKLAGPTWSDGEWKKTGGGGTVWDAMAYDPELDLLYFGVGNGTPWNYRRRSGGKGDNLFLSSIVAVRPDTGEYVWHYQTTPGESWDYTATQHIILANLTIGGQPRKVLMQAPKNGFFYVIDRQTGKLISAKNYVPVNWATGIDPKTGRPTEAPGIRDMKTPGLQAPGPVGGHNWQPMAFNPATGLVYIPTNMAPFIYGDSDAAYRPGRWNPGIDSELNTVPANKAALAKIGALVSSQLLAWDPVKQKAVWGVNHPYIWNSGVLTTGGGVVFQGGAEGELVAFDAGTGAKLWSYKTGNGVIAAPMSYTLNGDQYIAVMVGIGGSVQMSSPIALPARPRLPGRLIVFRLGGTAKVPEYDVPERPKVDLATLSSSGNVSRGFAKFHDNCQFCHGANASGTWLPDLRSTQILGSAESWKAVILDGASSSSGMASFKRFLSTADAEDLRAYVIEEARRSAQGRPPMQKSEAVAKP